MGSAVKYRIRFCKTSARDHHSDRSMLPRKSASILHELHSERRLPLLTGVYTSDGSRKSDDYRQPYPPVTWYHKLLRRQAPIDEHNEPSNRGRDELA